MNESRDKLGWKFAEYFGKIKIVDLLPSFHQFAEARYLVPNLDEFDNRGFEFLRIVPCEVNRKIT
jgi:hypothetical protein